MKRIGVLYGAEDLFPKALIDCIERMGVDGVEVMPVRVGGIISAVPAEFDVLVDRVSHQVPFFRSWLLAVARGGVRVINSPFAVGFDDDFYQCSVAESLGVTAPRTVLLPHKEHPEGTTSQSMRNLEYPLDWNAIFSYIGFPALLRDRTNRRTVSSRDDFFAAYDQTGKQRVLLQSTTRWEAEYRCYVVGADRLRVVNRESSANIPSPVLANRIKQESVGLIRSLGCEIGAVDFSIRNGVPFFMGFDAVPENETAGLGERTFRWFVDAVARLAIERAVHTAVSTKTMAVGR